MRGGASRSGLEFPGRKDVGQNLAERLHVVTRTFSAPSI